MKKLLPFIWLLCGLSAFAQQPVYSRVKILADNEGLRKIAGAGICVDHGEHKFNSWLITEIPAADAEVIRTLGYEVEVLVDDVAKYYAEQNAAGKYCNAAEVNANGCAGNCQAWPQPLGFSLGSFGGFFSLQEVLDNLDSMAAKFPNIISVKQSIGTGSTVEGRSIYYVKISDNSSVDESEPELLYNSLHHAREPESVSQLIYFMWYLLEHYGSDSTIDYLINNTEMYFIPVVNPDGYEYNRSTNPSGGGMWRKNRRNNGDGTFGVDLNRNYGYYWGYDNFGSSPNTSSDTYRGPSADSEPETQLMESFINAHQFRIAVNNHTYSDVLIYPFGYASNLLTPDSTQFTKYAQLMTRCDGFGYGTPNQTVGYNGNGAIDDWLYADTLLRPKVLSFTPEAGAASDGFWPAQARIIPIAQNTMDQNMYAAKLAAQLAEVNNTDELFIPAPVSYAHFNFTRIGMEPGSFTVTVMPVSANIASVGAPLVKNNPALLQTDADSIVISLGSVSPGDAVTYMLAVSNGAYTVYDTVLRIFGTPVLAFSDSCNAVSPQWTTTSWGVSAAQYVSPSGSLTESPTGYYPNNVTRIITTTNYIDLTDALAARVTFYGKWMVEAGYDYVELQASTDGTTWSSLCGHYTKPGSSSQDAGNPLYDGYQQSWLKEEANLADYIGQSIKLRFRFKSDGGVAYDGFYFDDAQVEKILSASADISETAGNFSFSLFPNPAQNEITVKTAGKYSGRPLSLQVCDISGRTIYSRTMPAAEAQAELPVAAFAPGLYFVRVLQSGRLLGMKRFIKEN